MVFVFSNTFFAQEVKITDAVKKTKAQEKTTKPKITEAVKTTKAKEASGVKLKKDGTPDERYKKANAPLKKDGTVDKRYKSKSNNASERGQERSAAGKAKAAANKSEAKAKKEVKERVSKEKAPKNNKDKVLPVTKASRKRVVISDESGEEEEDSIQDSDQDRETSKSSKSKNTTKSNGNAKRLKEPIEVDSANEVRIPTTSLI